MLPPENETKYRMLLLPVINKKSAAFENYLWASPLMLRLGFDQGNFKGESVVAAILPSCMEVSYFTSGFFVANPAKQFR